MGYHFIRVLPCSALHGCLFSSVLFILPLQKRPHFHLRLILGLILAFIVVAKLPPLRIVLFRALYLDKIHYAPLSYLAYTLTDVLPVLLLSCGLIYLCCDIRFHKAFYASSLAYLTQTIAFTAFNILFPDQCRDAPSFPIQNRHNILPHPGKCDGRSGYCAPRVWGYGYFYLPRVPL